MTDFIINDNDTDVDSDEELQEAFAKGLLQPGLNEIVEKSEKIFVNNVADMKAKLKDIKLKLPWVEILDLVTSVAPMAPDVALQMQDTAIRRKNLTENRKGKVQYEPAQDPVLNEFKRENLLHRQAQAATLEGLSKLHQLGVPTRRPDDYFAEMAKTDVHMQKVRSSLLTRQAVQARTDRVRQLRQQKQVAKRVQVDTKLKQAAEKKQMLEQLKRVRKGKSSDLSFLEDDKSKNRRSGGPGGAAARKKAKKDDKFGFGGKKRGSKLNSRESSNQMDGFNGATKTKSHFKNSKQRNISAKKRPGKSKRKNAKR